VTVTIAATAMNAPAPMKARRRDAGFTTTGSSWSIACMASRAATSYRHEGDRHDRSHRDECTGADEGPASGCRLHDDRFQVVDRLHGIQGGDFVPTPKSPRYGSVDFAGRHLSLEVP
jgi:hypothetical protein